MSLELFRSHSTNDIGEILEWFQNFYRGTYDGLSEIKEECRKGTGAALGLQPMKWWLHGPYWATRASAMAA
jgi:hypothetical protein